MAIHHSDRQEYSGDRLEEIVLCCRAPSDRTTGLAPQGARNGAPPRWHRIQVETHTASIIGSRTLPRVALF
jgi:hypothetical protein